MLDGPALRFGDLLGSERCQLVGPRVAAPELMYLSISSGDAPCFKVIYRGSSLARTTRLQLLGGTNIVHGRHLEILYCSRCTECSAEIWYDGYSFTFECRQD